MEEKKTGGKGFGLNRLFQKRPAEQEVETAPTAAEQEQEEKVALSQEILREARLTELGEAYGQVWKYWCADKPAPEQSILLGESAQPLANSTGALKRDRLVVTARLNQDLKKRLEDLQKTEKRKNEAEQELRAEQQADAARANAAGREEQAQPDSSEQTQEQLLEQMLQQELGKCAGVMLAPDCRVYLSSDKMYAWFLMFPPYNAQEEHVDESYGKLLLSALDQAGVTTGLHAEDLRKVLQDKPYMTLFCIAAGTPAVEGTDGKVVEHYERERKLEAAVDEHGNMDYRSTNFVCSVKTNDVICDLLPPVPGTPGVRLDGSELPPKPVRPAQISVGKNTALTEDGSHLIATKDGNLKFGDGRFYVTDMLELRGDVDYSTGNIDFVGDVRVYGGVREGFMVKATGNIRIDGLVEAATIEAGGDLAIAQGVVGNNVAVLRCKGDLKAKYLESVEVHGGKNISAECIINSQVFCDDSVMVNSGRGVIVGGSVSAANLIKAKVIGAQSDRLTELTLGECSYIKVEEERLQNALDEVTAEHKELDQKLHQIKRRLEQMGGDLDALSNNPALVQANERNAKLEERIAQLEAEMAELMSKKPDIFRCRLECGTIYPITTLKLHNAYWSTNDELKNCVVMYDKEVRELKPKYGCATY